MGLRGSVVVITGASSGIGRAAAIEFARRGAKAVVAARGMDELRGVATECNQYGSRTVAIATDVSSQSSVDELADHAVREFGRIDVWVNTAAVVTFGRFLDVPAEAFRRVLETNFFGTVHCARTALSRFKEQGGGVFIDVASVLGKEGIPYLSSYVASKEAVIGLLATLREEFKEHRVHVCTILPATIDTPIWEHGANYTGRDIRPIAPVYEPEQAVKAIVGCAENPRRMVYVGAVGPLVTLAHKVAPGMYERGAARLVKYLLFKSSRAQRSDGNLYEPTPPFQIHGKRQKRGANGLRYTALLAGAAGLAALAWSFREAVFQHNHSINIKRAA